MNFTLLRKQKYSKLCKEKFCLTNGGQGFWQLMACKAKIKNLKMLNVLRFLKSVFGFVSKISRWNYFSCGFLSGRKKKNPRFSFIVVLLLNLALLCIKIVMIFSLFGL